MGIDSLRRAVGTLHAEARSILEGLLPPGTIERVEGILRPSRQGGVEDAWSNKQPGYSFAQHKLFDSLREEFFQYLTLEKNALHDRRGTVRRQTTTTSTTATTAAATTTTTAATTTPTTPSTAGSSFWLFTVDH